MGLDTCTPRHLRPGQVCVQCKCTDSPAFDFELLSNSWQIVQAQVSSYSTSSPRHEKPVL